MIGKSANQNQRDLFKLLLKDFIDLGHELVLLSERMDWSYFDKSFGRLYSTVSFPKNNNFIKILEN